MGSRGSRVEGGLVVRFRVVTLARNCNCGARERYRYCGWINRRAARRVGVRRDIVVVLKGFGGRKGESGVDALRMS
jgi:hypothetical protein